jgi:hypothetical protein
MVFECAALRRIVERYEQVYGLRVSGAAPESPVLRGRRGGAADEA